MFVCSCDEKKSNAYLNEGLIEFDISYPPEVQHNFMSRLLPKKMTMSFKGNVYKNEIISLTNDAIKNLELWKKIDLKYKLFKKKDIDKNQWKIYKQKVREYKSEVEKSISVLIAISTNIKKSA